MSGDSSEEKKHPASSKKLRNLRDKEGQVPKSQDFPVVISLLLVFVYIYMNFRGIMSSFRDLFNVVFLNFGLDFATRAKFILPTIGSLVMILILPTMIIASIATIFATFWNTKGLVINKKAIAPNFTKLNPVTGFKNMFKLQTLIDLGKGLTKIILLAICTILIMKGAISSILIAPSCGVECVLNSSAKLFMYLIIMGLSILLLGAFLDLPLSDWLFKRDQKMSDTEVKREQKEDMGDPHIRSARKQRHRQLIEGGPTGIQHANVLIIGKGVAIGISYVRGETPAPITMAKGTGAKAAEMLQYARTHNMIVYEEPELANDLIGRSPMGDFVPRAYFMPVAKVLVDVGLV